ncbi:single-stranded DNA-binding protein [Cutibacterium sp. WCA-380-WT-3A]|uniref:Single-stranded DNA-binding protein n=1 Tax=Cutibacterium porci TaxID=2605781 RepID=A0A7K0J5X2_9ACTN|nr:single-stranded DNA-binding protein [Cutibacterium porci]MSS45317.1 single-stranded DNA-binding protein [Cutibacterium porci]
MANNTQITIVGNLTSDPDMRFTSNGTPVANFTVASTPSQYDKQRGEWVNGETMFLGCSVWGQAAENVAESLYKGTRVMVQGNLKARTWQDRGGNRRTSYEIDVNEIGPSLRFARVSQPQLNAPSGTKPQDSGRPKQPQRAVDPWGQQQSDEAPF